MRKVAALLCVLPLLAACAGSKIMKAEIDATKQSKAKLAVISMTVNDFGGALQSTSSSDVASLVTRKLDGMLATTEASLGANWTVVPAAQFVGTEAYKKLSIGSLFEGVYGPKPGGADMLSFSAKRKDLVKTSLDPKVASDLCAALGVELVALVYSEWQTITGGIIPTTKPLTKNVIGIFDNQGRCLFQGRMDVKGKKSLGAFGLAVVDEASLDAWIEAYAEGLNGLMARM